MYGKQGSRSAAGSAAAGCHLSTRQGCPAGRASCLWPVTPHKIRFHIQWEEEDTDGSNSLGWTAAGANRVEIVRRRTRSTDGGTVRSPDSRGYPAMPQRRGRIESWISGAATRCLGRSRGWQSGADPGGDGVGTLIEITYFKVTWGR